jgi:hypothetical protein
MLTITSANVLKLTKGNSCIIDITPIDTETKQPYILQSGEKVLFTIKNRIEQTVLQKELTSEDYGEEDTSLNCVIEPADTIGLNVGEYFYDCLLLMDDGQAITFISSKFIILDAAGYYTDGGESNG